MSSNRLIKKLLQEARWILVSIGLRGFPGSRLSAAALWSDGESGEHLADGSGGEWQSFGLEALLTFFLMLVIMAMATDTRAVGQAAVPAIGSTVGLEALFAGPISGASMNPARSFGSALLNGTWAAQ